MVDNNIYDSQLKKKKGLKNETDTNQASTLLK